LDSNRNSGTKTIDAQTIDARPAVLTMPEPLFSREVLPAVQAVADLSHGSAYAHRRHPMTTGFRWRGKGEVCPQTTSMAAANQVGRIAGYGSPVVTDSTFSTSMGPPSCSPPV
jgi:hypothetical protein